MIALTFATIDAAPTDRQCSLVQLRLQSAQEPDRTTLIALVASRPLTNEGRSTWAWQASGARLALGLPDHSPVVAPLQSVCSHLVHTWRFRASSKPRDPSVSHGSRGLSMAVTVGFELRLCNNFAAPPSCVGASSRSIRGFAVGPHCAPSASALPKPFSPPLRTGVRTSRCAGSIHLDQS